MTYIVTLPNNSFRTYTSLEIIKFKWMRMKSLVLSLFFICTAGHTQSELQSKLITPEQLKVIEEQVDNELQSSKLDNKKKLIANLLAGREFYQYRFFDKSKKYYQAAIDLNTDENKTEAYINLMAISIVEKDKTQLRAFYNQAVEYFKAHSNFHSEDIKYYLNSIDGYLTGKNTETVKGFYGQFNQESNLVELVKSKKYSEAMAMINPVSLKGNDNLNLEVIIYDSLNVVLNKKSVKKLNCTDEYKKYPNAYTYSTLICGLLNDYVVQSKFNPKRLKRAENYFSKDNIDKAYLLEVVKEIK